MQQAGAGREEWLQRPLGSFPPIVEVDGVWITLMKSLEEKHPDRLGRMRQKKVGQRYVILFARGCWPTTGKHSLLTWLVAEKESEESWGDLLFAVKQIKLRTPGRWDLLIADGAGGLEAARQTYCPDVPLQRCIFHKLRNLLCNLAFPAETQDRGMAYFFCPQRLHFTRFTAVTVKLLGNNEGGEPIDSPKSGSVWFKLEIIF